MLGFGSSDPRSPAVAAIGSRAMPRAGLHGIARIGARFAANALLLFATLAALSTSPAADTSGTSAAARFAA